MFFGQPSFALFCFEHEKPECKRFAVLRRGIFPTCVGVRPFVADALAPADGGRQAQGAVAGEPGGGDPDGGDEALRPRLCCDRHHGAAEGGDVSDRRQAAQPGARVAGATDEKLG